MTPGLLGRIETRWFPLAVVGSLVTLAVAPALHGGSVGDRYRATFTILVIDPWPGSPGSGSTPPRESSVDNDTRISDSHLRLFPRRSAILRPDGGLAASPPVGYTLRVERSGRSPFP
jgi:hypothetical protein